MNKTMTIVFIGNGSPNNGGCEAITKGTKEILSQTFATVRCIDCFFDYTGKYSQDPEHDTYPVQYPRRYTIKWFLLQIALKCSYTLTAKLLLSGHKEIIRKADAVLSLGGDNYSLDYGKPKRFISIGKYVKKNNVPFVIWGASIGPFVHNSAFENEIAEHLRKDVSLILSREEVTTNYLHSIGVKENVRNVADPAFMMKPEKPNSNNNLTGQYICVNFSDLMAKYVTCGDIDKWITICRRILTELLLEYKHKIILIPHVKSDFTFMEKIISSLDSERLILADKSLNAAKMKWIISRSECNIACRTHSTIASFSTSVPTISLGYSIKAKGLNHQMYGNENYMAYRSEITPEKIISIFKEVYGNKDKIKKELEEKNIKIKSEALKAGAYLKELIENK